MLSADENDAIDRSATPSAQQGGGSAGFIEILRELATQGRIEDISLAAKRYCSRINGKKPYISGRIPGILNNDYFSTIKGFDFQKFGHWSTANPDWADGIKSSWENPKNLSSAVAHVVQESQKFQIP